RGGKSCLNIGMLLLLLGKALKVGGEPGITKAVLTKIPVSFIIIWWIQLGVLSPRTENIETGMKLALCTILDHLVGEDVIADYLTVIDDACDNFFCKYVEKYNLEEPCNDIQHVLKSIAVNLGKTKRVKAITGVGEQHHVQLPDSSAAAYDFIRAFRKGELGKVMLD
uniref:Mitochondrial ribosome-associated GTPase 1 n=1 Tax=Cyprinus carpio TaxID=7962 RepID=A0A8C1LIN7_CYPCA